MSTFHEHGQKIIRGEVPPPPIGRLLGIALKTLEAGHAVLEMQVDERHHNPLGTLHGGVYCDLGDLAMGNAFASTLGEGRALQRSNLKSTFCVPCDGKRSPPRRRW